MRKKLPTPQLIALIFLAGGCSAHAHDVAAIYGVVDAYASDTRGSKNVRRMGEGAHTASRIGLRGREDLGSGAFASYTLEMGLNLNDGSVPLGGGFGRQASVSAGNKTWGQVSLGLQYTPVFMQLLRTATFGMNVNWAPIQVITRSDSQGDGLAQNAPSLRVPSLLRYRYGDGKGLSVDLALGLKETASRRGRMFGASVGYADENYFVGVSTQRIATPASAKFSGATYVHAISGYWRASGWKFNANFIVTGSSVTGTRRADHLVIGARHQLGPHAMMAELTHRNVRGSRNDAHIIGLGYDYSLSKRTRLYSRILLLNNRAAAAVSMATAMVDPSSGDNVRAVSLGIIHNF